MKRLLKRSIKPACRTIKPKPSMSIPVPDAEPVVKDIRPMSKKRIFKLDRKGVMADAKQFAEVKSEKVLNFWAYLSDPDLKLPSQRMRKSRVYVNVHYEACD